jgi:hypothetical protein
MLSALVELWLATPNVFPLFTLSGAHISTLMIVLRDSLSEGIRKLETCLILKEDRSLVCV